MQNLNTDIEKYHVSNCSHLDVLQKIMDTFTLSLRTYENVEFPTIEDRQEAEQQDNELSKEFASFAPDATLEQCSDFSIKLLSGSYSEYICNKHLEKSFPELGAVLMPANQNRWIFYLQRKMHSIRLKILPTVSRRLLRSF